MPYTDLDTAEHILLAVEFVGRGMKIPADIAAALGPALCADLTSPEKANGRPARGALTAHQ